MTDGLIAFLAVLGVIVFMGTLYFLFMWGMWRDEQRNEREREKEK